MMLDEMTFTCPKVILEDEARVEDDLSEGDMGRG